MMLVIQMAMLICLRMCHQIDVLLLRLDVQNVYMKISMICYTDAKFDESEVVHSALQRVISIFGSDRCMFGSNYPVDVKDGWPSNKLFPALLNLVKHLGDDAVRAMFSANARRAYRVDK
eukprot:m.179882 g.179882  ORF g.179882 m.179882 type:complete len:119 (+) comp18401_c0_seq5:76-432(+)